MDTAGAGRTKGTHSSLARATKIEEGGERYLGGVVQIKEEGETELPAAMTERDSRSPRPAKLWWR
jgi:hypothetical protein